MLINMRFLERCRAAILAGSLVMLTACGGGGGSSGSTSSTGSGVQSTDLTLSVSPSSVNVSAATTDPAPTGVISFQVAGKSGVSAYISGSYSTHGIASTSDAGDGNGGGTVTLTFKPPGSLGVGVYTDSVLIKACIDQGCTQQFQNSPQTVAVTYTVTAPPPPPPSISSLSPSNAMSGGAGFTLTVNGTGFTNGSTIFWDDAPLTTAFVSPTQLTASIPASYIATAQTNQVFVNTTSIATNSLNFQVLQSLELYAANPSVLNVGHASYTMTALGAGFVSGATLNWNGTALSTTYVSSTELQAQVPATDVAAATTAQVTVQLPAGGATSSALPVSVVTPAPDAVAFQINPAHSGIISFNNVSLPTVSKWSVNVGGKPSFALVADGKVFVTVGLGTGSNASSQVLALDQATGATVWGPILISGVASAAYENGTVFVIGAAGGSVAADLYAYDANTGTQKWTTQLVGQYAFTSGITAINGMVYTGGAGSGGTLYAVNEATGLIVWAQLVQNGDGSTPAVTETGIYVSYPCQTYDFDPASSNLLWNTSTGCEGGGGATPVVANGLIYSPDGTGTYNGDILDAQSGTVKGSYVADTPPAIASQNGYFLQSGTLRGLTLSNNTVLWSFTGDGMLDTAPIAVNSYVFIGSSSGNLYGLDGTTGNVVWQVNVGAAIPATGGWFSSLPLEGLAAGDGLLVVPAGNTVTAFVLSTNP